MESGQLLPIYNQKAAKKGRAVISSAESSSSSKSACPSEPVRTTGSSLLIGLSVISLFFACSSTQRFCQRGAFQPHMFLFPRQYLIFLQIPAYLRLGGEIPQSGYQSRADEPYFLFLQACGQQRRGTVQAKVAQKRRSVFTDLCVGRIHQVFQAGQTKKRGKQAPAFLFIGYIQQKPQGNPLF